MSEQRTIGKLARAAGVAVDTVRYYERIGLLPQARRAPSGYRLYGRDDLRQLRFIRRAQTLGFSLEEIGRLLELMERDGDRAEVRALAEIRLADIEAKMHQFASLRDTLRCLVEACRGHGSVADCPIIEAVVGGVEDANEP